VAQGNGPVAQGNGPVAQGNGPVAVAQHLAQNNHPAAISITMWVLHSMLFSTISLGLGIFLFINCPACYAGQLPWG